MCKSISGGRRVDEWLVDKLCPFSNIWMKIFSTSKQEFTLEKLQMLFTHQYRSPVKCMASLSNHHGCDLHNHHFQWLWKRFYLT